MMASGQHQQQHGNMMGGHQGQRGVPPPVKKPAMPKASNLPPPLVGHAITGELLKSLSKVDYLASVPLNTELLARPEADQLMQGLNSGNITVLISIGYTVCQSFHLNCCNLDGLG